MKSWANQGWPFWQTIAFLLLLLQGQKEETGTETGIRWYFWYFYFHQAFSWHASCSPCPYGTAVIPTSESAGLCCHLCYSGVYGCTEIGAWNEKGVYEGGWIQDFLSAFKPIFVSLFHEKELLAFQGLMAVHISPPPHSNSSRDITGLC